MANIRNWLESEMEKREWSQADLARHAKISRTAVSNLLSGRRNIGKELALAIAKAFNIPLEDVYKATGDIAQTPGERPMISKAIHLLEQLESYEQEEILEQIKLKLRLTKMRGNNAAAPKPIKRL